MQTSVATVRKRFPVKGSYMLCKEKKLLLLRITLGKLLAKISCDLNHKSITNSQPINVNNITINPCFRLFFSLCSFFTRIFCDKHHTNEWYTPRINVIKIT